MSASQVVLVTGVSSGIGFKTVQLLAGSAVDSARAEAQRATLPEGVIMLPLGRHHLRAVQ